MQLPGLGWRARLPTAVLGAVLGAGGGATQRDRALMRLGRRDGLSITVPSRGPWIVAAATPEKWGRVWGHCNLSPGLSGWGSRGEGGAHFDSEGTPEP